MESTADWFGLSFRNFVCTALLASDFSLKKVLVSQAIYSQIGLKLNLWLHRDCALIQLLSFGRSKTTLRLALGIKMSSTP